MISLSLTSPLSCVPLKISKQKICKHYSFLVFAILILFDRLYSNLLSFRYLGCGMWRVTVYYCWSHVQTKPWKVADCPRLTYPASTRRPGYDPRQTQNTFPLASVSRPALRATQPPVKWVPESFPEGNARSRRDADHSPNTVPRSRMSRSYASSPLAIFSEIKLYVSIFIL
jgi:hypothetical protein